MSAEGVSRMDSGADPDGPSLGEVDGEPGLEPSLPISTVSTNDDAPVSVDAGVALSDAGPKLGDAASSNVDSAVVELSDDQLADAAGTNDTSSSDQVAEDAAIDEVPIANSCAIANGGCDSLAPCIDGDSLSCGPCPEGYSGSGQSGCVPVLLGLAVDEGTLIPDFEPEQSQYALALGLFAETVVLSIEAPAGSTLSIGGEDIGTAANWTSPTLNLGENLIQVDLLRDGEVVNNYLVTVTRHDQIDFLKATKAHPSGVFGWDVALSADRSTLAIGTPGDPSVSQGLGGDPSNDDAPGTGAVYVFTRNAGGWVNEAYLKASNAEEGDSFGRSVALSSDGNTLVVGAVGEDSNAFVVGGDGENDEASGAGAAYVFRRAGGGWSQEAYLKASNCGAGDLFGADVAIAAEGDLIAVAASMEDSADSGVGAIEDNDDALSSGAVYLFGRDNGQWNQEAYVKASNCGAGDGFGSAIDLSADGNVLAVGAQYEASSAMGVGGIETDDTAASAGAAYVFRRAFGAWSQQAYVKASNTEPGDAFGFSVALSPDGTVLAVGAPKEDSDAEGIDGDDDNNAAMDAGAVYLFALGNDGWRQTSYVKASNSAADSAFGFSVDLSTNALDLVVGAASENSEATGVNGDQADLDATRAGAAYLFKYVSDGWRQRAYLKASNTDPYDRFGNSTVVSPDGSVVAIGAYVEDSSGSNPNDNASENAGAVYVY